MIGNGNHFHVVKAFGYNLSMPKAFTNYIKLTLAISYRFHHTQDRVVDYFVALCYNWYYLFALPGRFP